MSSTVQSRIESTRLHHKGSVLCDCLVSDTARATSWKKEKRYHIMSYCLMLYYFQQKMYKHYKLGSNVQKENQSQLLLGFMPVLCRIGSYL